MEKDDDIDMCHHEEYNAEQGIDAHMNATSCTHLSPSQAQGQYLGDRTSLSLSNSNGMRQISRDARRQQRLVLKKEKMADGQLR